MAKTVQATRAQIRAARLIMERSTRGIGQSSAAVEAIAQAQPARPTEVDEHEEVRARAPMELGGGHVVDSEGTGIGAVGQVYLDDRTEEPAWVTVNTGLFGTKETFIPLYQADIDGDNLRVPYSKDEVMGAPKVDVGEHLDVDQEEELYRYYGLDYSRDMENSLRRLLHDVSGPGGA